MKTEELKDTRIKLTWEEFCKLHVVDTYNDKIFEIKEGDEIVTLVKSLDRLIGVLRIGVQPGDIDYVGCSTGYVREKIHLLKSSVEWLDSRLKETEKVQRDKNRENKKLLKQYMRSLKTVSYIGEDGDMAVNCKTALGALRKFRAQVRDDVGDYEASEMKIDDIGTGWLRLPTEEDVEEYGDGISWFITWDEKEKTQYQVWVYRV